MSYTETSLLHIFYLSYPCEYNIPFGITYIKFESVHSRNPVFIKGQHFLCNLIIITFWDLWNKLCGVILLSSFKNLKLSEYLWKTFILFKNKIKMWTHRYMLNGWKLDVLCVFHVIVLKFCHVLDYVCMYSKFCYSILN